MKYARAWKGRNADDDCTASMSEDFVKVKVSIELRAESYSEAMRVLDEEDLTVDDALFFLLLECARSGRWPLPPEGSYLSQETLDAIAEAERALEDPDTHWMTFEELMRELNS